MKLNSNLTKNYIFTRTLVAAKKLIILTRTTTTPNIGCIGSYYYLHYNQFHKSNLTTGFLILNGYLLGAGSVVGITISDDFASGCFSIIVFSGIIISGSMTDCVVSQKSDFLIWSACRFQIFPGVVSTL
jgi:hypothetical protein